MPKRPDSSGHASHFFTTLAEIDAWLPQTQCTRCGYPRCRDYAKAIYRGEIGINRCPPGGKTTIAGLAQYLDRDMRPLDAECGIHKPRVLAVIDESRCIGCKLCIQACPVDAIVGRAKRMHTVLPELCTGCELCLPPCPVDCIDLVDDTVHKPVSGSRWPEYSWIETGQAHVNTVLRLRRLQRLKNERAQKRKGKTISERSRIRGEIRAAVERVKRRRETN